MGVQVEDHNPLDVGRVEEESGGERDVGVGIEAELSTSASAAVMEPTPMLIAHPRSSFSSQFHAQHPPSHLIPLVWGN